MMGERSLPGFPVEIWERIFHFNCLSSMECRRVSLAIGRESDGEWAVIMPPFILTHVCQRWRDIVNRSPRLWCSITVELSAGYPKGWTKLVETFLERSMPHPLDLDIYLSNTMANSEWAQATWETLKYHFSRSEVLHLDFHSWLDPDPFISFRDMDVTLNNLLSFHGGDGFAPVDDNGDMDINNPFWRALSQAPKLTRVQLNVFYPLEILPFQQLTELVIESVGAGDLEEFLEMLEVSRSLRNLKIDCFLDAKHLDILTINPRSVVLPSLNTLSICPGVDWEEIEPVEITNPLLEVFCASVVMPSLFSFELSCSPPSDTKHSWPESLLGMLERSSATLHIMTLSLDSRSPSTWEPLSQVLRTTPHVCELYLIDIRQHKEREENAIFWNSFIRPFLSDLTNITKEAILPNLTHLSLISVPVTTDVVKTMLNVAGWRSPAKLPANDRFVRPLRAACVLHSDLDPELDSPGIESVVEPYSAVIEALEKVWVSVVFEDPRGW
ncbi:hypothetical protein L218DRAFT_1080632 [Marasmius fiardii PR-910]|nr:hypothetical protein L218DRAFT_1080632 [Marasmius fiardii PR-910]